MRSYVSHILSPEAQLWRTQRGFSSEDETDEAKNARERAATYSMPPKRRDRRTVVTRFEQMKISESEDHRAMPIVSVL